MPLLIVCLFKLIWMKQKPAGTFNDAHVMTDVIFPHPHKWNPIEVSRLGNVMVCLLGSNYRIRASGCSPAKSHQPSRTDWAVYVWKTFKELEEEIDDDSPHERFFCQHQEGSPLCLSSKGATVNCHCFPDTEFPGPWGTLWTPGQGMSTFAFGYLVC